MNRVKNIHILATDLVGNRDRWIERPQGILRAVKLLCIILQGR